jgi:D-arabinose 1-dehydrogenase-like Zn-dependent alcohol dehydrogenase
MRWVTVLHRGRRGSELVSAGTGAMTARVASAGAAILAIAGIFRFQASAMMAGTRNTCSRRWRRWCRYPGDLVAVQGIGGLGHLGIQFASKFGYKVAAIGRGPETAPLAQKLGASLYIDSQATNPAEALQSLGGAAVILATAPSAKAMSALIDGLGPNGKLMVIGASPDPIEATPIQLISGSRTIQGWASGTALGFAELSGVRPMIETYPLESAAEAYARMLSGKAQFRVVLTM